MASTVHGVDAAAVKRKSMLDGTDLYEHKSSDLSGSAASVAAHGTTVQMPVQLHPCCAASLQHHRPGQQKARTLSAFGTAMEAVRGLVSSHLCTIHRPIVVPMLGLCSVLGGVSGVRQHAWSVWGGLSTTKRMVGLCLFFSSLRNPWLVLVLGECVAGGTYFSLSCMKVTVAPDQRTEDRMGCFA
eukprot:2894890-Amphidinium_carterae.1